MGRQAFITRVALGRSALEPIDAHSLQDGPETLPAEAESEPQLLNMDTADQRDTNVANLDIQSMGNSIVARSYDYQQQYDAKGYPTNRSSDAARRRRRHAVNDVLATVGICMSKGENPMQYLIVPDLGSVDEIRRINEYGDLLGDSSPIMMLASESWTILLGKRFQTFRFYADIALVEIIKIEWKNFGALQFLFAGLPSAAAFWFLDSRVSNVTMYGFRALRNATTSRLKTGTRWQKLFGKVIEVAETLVDVSLFTLISPLKYFSMLQELDLQPPLAILPSLGTYKSALATIFSSKQRFGCLNTFSFLLLFYVTNRHQSLAPKISRYVWAALPKPTRPDALSMAAAQKDGLDSLNISGLIDESTPQEICYGTSVVDQLARDLQKLGKSWQILYNHCTELLRFAFPSSRPGLESLRQNQKSTVYLDMEAAGVDETSSHNVPNRNALNSPISTPTPDRLEHGQPSRSSTSSSSPPSLPDSPPAIELTHQYHGGHVYVNVSIPQPSGAPPDTPQEGVELRARRASFFRDFADQHEETPRQDQDQPYHVDDDLAQQMTYENLYPQENDKNVEPQHRVTALSAYPAYSIGERLSHILSNALYLPIDAFLLRALTIAFLSSPAPSPFSVEVAARWKREVYSPWPWLAPAWRPRGLSGAGNYLGKMILILGLRAGVSFVIWQVEMGTVWWIGTTCDAWTNPNSEQTEQ